MKTSSFKIKNTLGMFDLLKGAVMFSMIIGHTHGLVGGGNQNPISMVISFVLTFFGEAAMPALMIVSGYGFRKAPTKKCFVRLYKTLLIPYFITVVLTAVARVLGNYFVYGGFVYSVKEAVKVLLGGLVGVTRDTSIAGHMIYDCGPCWFMMALVLACLIFNELLKHFKGKNLFVASLVISCIGWALSLGPGLPFTISQGLVSTLYICIGYMAKKEKFFVSLTETKKIVGLSLGAVIVNLIFKGLGGEFYLAHSTYSYGPIAIFVTAASATAVIYWFLHLNRYTGKISSGLRNVGRNSLYVLCAHSIEYTAIGKYVQIDFFEKWVGSSGPRILAMIALRIIVDFTLAYGYVGVKKYFSNKQEGEKGEDVIERRNSVWKQSLKKSS
ncbi:Fucose 4-O-acetylase [Pseudobutyrivibrio sp. YE44]|uniref:acyltransferase family protein n=1 Tax=Pseudobutyrivibrio sp. YE44 TaxID=1520802 RepID=UPI000885DB47|nr:acyltransferase [Pseudobutyrivibrio sp. YE44]SDB46266.1 Fucose 4-O-acetylase [Pseudobutyrivibrio sp. YE44]